LFDTSSIDVEDQGMFHMTSLEHRMALAELEQDVAQVREADVRIRLAPWLPEHGMLCPAALAD
jgi:hypothetical protein